MSDRDFANSGHLDIVAELEQAGVPLPSSAVDALVAAGRKKDVAADEAAIQSGSDDRHHLWLWRADARKFAENTGYNHLSYSEKIPQEWVDLWADREIMDSDWMPESLIEHAPEFRKFIDSHIPRFCDLMPYTPFWLYTEQAYRWLQDTTSIIDLDTPEDMRQYGIEEVSKISRNSLYAMHKYAWIKEAEAPSGKRKWIASTPQALLLYLFDCGYSIYVGKGRQAAITSTMAPAAMFRALTKTNTVGVVAADDLEVTGKGIFEDKIKFPLLELDDWMKPEGIARTSTKELMMDFDPGQSKSDRKRLSGKVSLVAATATAINGQTPSWVLLDEATDMDQFDKIVLEINPTQYRLNEETFKLDVARQLVAWSTGTSGGKGKGRYENAYKELINKWQQKKNTGAYVPLFFDKTCRPGWTPEFDKDRREFYLTGGMDGDGGQMSMEERIAMYRAHYPSTPEDMFMATHKTLVPIRIIHNAVDAIDSLPPSVKPVRGRFEPVFDTAKPMPEGSFLPFKLKGATFVPANDDETDAPVEMFLPPDNGWLDRYYQGTDPLLLDDGLSHNSAAIYDAVGAVSEENGGEVFHPTIACVVDHRSMKAEDSYLQMVLMGMHYYNHGQAACPDLVEVNAGKGYMDFKQDPFVGLRTSLILKNQLPDLLRGGNHTYGIDNKSERKQHILDAGKSLIYAHGTRIFIRKFWSQLRTIEVTMTSEGKQRWGTIDARKYRDDVVFSSFFAYIARQCFAGRQPRRVDAANPRRKVVIVPKRNADLSISMVKEVIDIK